MISNFRFQISDLHEPRRSPRYTPKAFTLIEVLITVALTSILIGAAAPIYSNLQVSAQLNESTEQFISALRLMRTRAVERVNNQTHGVYVEVNPTSADRYVLFQGASYEARNQSYDRGVTLDGALALSVSLSNGATEIVFTRARGVPSATGTITLTHATYGSRTITVNAVGMVEQE